MLIKAGDGLWLLTGIKWSRTPAISDLQNPVRLVEMRVMVGVRVRWGKSAQLTRAVRDGVRYARP